MRIHNRTASADTNKRLCPVCGSSDTSAGFNGRVTENNRRIDRATAGCHICAAMWSESYYVRSGETVVSDIRPGALQAAIAADKANTQLPSQAEFVEFVEATPRPRAISHSHHEGDGCPLCGAIHIAVKPRGNAAAECICVDCGAEWSHRYEHGIAHRTNIKASIKEAV